MSTLHDPTGLPRNDMLLINERFQAKSLVSWNRLLPYVKALLLAGLTRRPHIPDCVLEGQGFWWTFTFQTRKQCPVILLCHISTHFTNLCKTARASINQIQILPTSSFSLPSSSIRLYTSRLLLVSSPPITC